MSIITCTCGAKVHLPEEARGKSYRCPRCKQTVPATVDAKVLASFTVRDGAVGAVCPICQSTIQEGDGVLICPSCEQVHHTDCWREIGGCSTYGCKEAPAPEKEASAQAPLTAWGDTKTCPACGETIKSIALRCRYCGTQFDTVDPLKAADLRRGARKEEELRSVRTMAIVLFALSLVSCLLAPLIALVSVLMLVPRRQLLAKAGPVYQVLGYSAIGLSVLYSVLIGLFLLAGMRG